MREKIEEKTLAKYLSTYNDTVTMKQAIIYWLNGIVIKLIGKNKY